LKSAVLPRVDLKPAIMPAVRYLRRPLAIIGNYDREKLRPDLIAGLTVAVIMLPQAIAFAVLAELPPVMGLYAAVVGSIVGALWGSSDQSHNGPTNANSILILSALLGAGFLPGNSDFIVAAGLMAVMAGAFQLLLGLARLGILVNFVSYSVIVGFSAGAGVLIAIKQLLPLLGLALPARELYDILWVAASNLDELHLASTLLGLGTIAVLFVLPLASRRIPAALIAMLLAALAVWLFDLNARGVEVIGEIEGRLPPLVELPVFNLNMLGRLSTGALAVGAIGLVQTMAMARSMAAQTGQRLDSNQEFVGQGLSNMASGFFSGFPVAGSFSRSAVNLQAGARSGMAAVFSGIFVLIAMMVLGPAGAYLPVSALAGVLIVIGFGLVDVREIRRILQGTRADALIMVITLSATLLLPIEFAVLLGIMLSFVHYALRTSMPRVHEVVPDADYRHFAFRPDADVCPQLGVVDIEGDLYFGAVNHVEETIYRLHERHPYQHFLLIRMQHVNHVDFSGIHMLENVLHHYRELGGDVFFQRVGARVRQTMETTGFLRLLGANNLLGIDDAIDHIFHNILDPAICIYECPVRVFRECQNLPKQTEVEAIPHLSDIPRDVLIAVSPRELWRQLTDDGGAPAIIDVREPREFHQGHIPDARLVPLRTILSDSVRLPNDRRIVLVCRTGRRSQRAAYALHKMGCMDVAVLEGGMRAWEAANLLEAIDLPDSGDGVHEQESSP
jgi:sulfate permease, SulP family